MLNFCEGDMSNLSTSGARSWRAAVLISRMLRLLEFTCDSDGTAAGASMVEVSVTVSTGAWLSTGGREKSVMAALRSMTGSSGAATGCGGNGIGAGAGIGVGSGIGVTGAGSGVGNGPTDSANSPVSPSGTEDGAAIGSAKTGSLLVLFVISLIACCKSLSTVGFWFICPPLFIILMLIVARFY